MRVPSSIGESFGDHWVIDKRTVGAHKSGGHAIHKSKVNAFMANGGAIASMIGWEKHNHHDEQDGDAMADMTEKLHEASDEIDSAHKRFMESRGKFSANIKNEIASIEASSKKVTTEFNRIASALSALTAMYTSGDFVAAIENAERLATALSSIQQLQNSKLTFAVIENSISPGDPQRQPSEVHSTSTAAP